jgi:hypothetical protein
VGACVGGGGGGGGGGGRLAAGRRAGDASDDDDADDGGPVCLEEAECMYDRFGNDSSTHSGPISFLYDHSATCLLMPKGTTPVPAPRAIYAAVRHARAVP